MQEAASIRADSVERTATPNFPAECPGTPYLNHNGHHHVVTNASPHSPSSSSGRSAATTGPLSSNDSGFSAGAQPSAEKLPPKSPPSSRLSFNRRDSRWADRSSTYISQHKSSVMESPTRPHPPVYFLSPASCLAKSADRLVREHSDDSAPHQSGTRRQALEMEFAVITAGFS
ncbi:unnamed protein product [Notodromas monacha]|uniref:Uncharacterized protein n=1 Tax=Notodromas monacha TaxID=399045 RepID=A0A7R9GE78_9CRUS|nr:unnamed protein product [Notodromas monacha]CAG0919329.1 unnamed protein product [Notodromas monacha]